MILELNKNEFADIFEVKVRPIIKDKCYLELITLNFSEDILSCELMRFHTMRG